MPATVLGLTPALSTAVERESEGEALLVAPASPPAGAAWGLAHAALLRFEKNYRTYTINY